MCLFNSWLILFVALVWGGDLQAYDLVGRTLSVDGKPIPHVRVRLVTPDEAAYSSTVFSDGDGKFSIKGLSGHPENAQLDFFRIGWQEVDRRSDLRPGTAAYAITLRPMDNVAAQVPPSAWLRGDKSSLAYALSNLQC